MLRDEYEIFGRRTGYSYRWSGFDFPASRKRNCPVRRRDGKKICEILAAQRMVVGGWKKNGKIFRQFLYPKGYNQKRNWSPRLPLLAPDGKLPDPGELRLGGSGGRGKRPKTAPEALFGPRQRDRGN